MKKCTGGQKKEQRASESLPGLLSQASCLSTRDTLREHFSMMMRAPPEMGRLSPSLPQPLGPPEASFLIKLEDGRERNFLRQTDATQCSQIQI
eukprot:jgi/Botrbrau1/21823/Bobra.0190s0039.2